jgi:beta-lactam-binding protein with PASTA domain/tRNA A-37 threonylcarbamoyl transferase component Bud32
METSAGTRVADPLVGRVIDGRYRVENRLARGGMATVYEATDLRLDRTVALKIMHASLADDAAFVSRFVREAKSAARLTDPHVVAVYDQGDDDGIVYLVMEYVPGRTVRDVLRQHGRLSGEQALTILDPVLQALDAAHHAGFVHRDIKPENVLLTDDGRVKVADFGLARAISAATSTAATQGLLIGTVAYLSPEQVERGIADARSDVYGAGILLYEMVTGAVPFAGETPLAVAYQHVNHEVPLPSSIRPGIPPVIDDLVVRATERDADERFPDAAEFLASVRAARTELPSPLPFGVREEPANAATLVVRLDDGTEPGAVAGAPAGKRPSKPPNAVRPKGPKRKRRKGPIALLVVLLLGALVAGGAWYYGVAKTVPMPTVIGMTPDKAQQKLSPDQLSLDSSQTDFSETVPAGRIISTDPGPGSDVREGSTVTAVVSKGQERYAVPQVANASVDDATQALTDGSLTLGKTTQAYSDTVQTGLVISTNPPAGTKLKRDQAVDLVVSKGRAPVKLPKLVGQSQAAATAALTKAGLKVTTSQGYSKTVPSGSVMATTPGAGVTVPRGSSVNLVISQGPPLTPVPDVYKMSEADAKARLKAAGFKVDVTYPIGITPFGRVVSQSVDAGKSIPWGSTIQIQVV